MILKGNAGGKGYLYNDAAAGVEGCRERGNLGVFAIMLICGYVWLAAERS